jgi:hypothetical protein
LGFGPLSTSLHKPCSSFTPSPPSPSRPSLNLTAENEAKALDLEEKREQAAIEENAALQNSLQTQIFKLQEEMDAMRAQMEWDEAQLKEWLENAQLREEDTEALKKYEREDETRAKELLLELEKLNVSTATSCFTDVLANLPAS